jgi:hypothetical protein
LEPYAAGQSRQNPVGSGHQQTALGWAGGALLITTVVAVIAKIVGVVIAPGARGAVGEKAVNFFDMISGACAYTLTALLVALVCGASFELARTKSVNVIARGGVVAVSGLIVALASPAVVDKLSERPALALAVISSIVALVAGVTVVRTSQTRAVGAILGLLAMCALLRIGAWMTSAVAFERGSQNVLNVARVFSTVAIAIQAFSALLAAAWIGTRSKWRGRILANLAIFLAFGITYLAARTSDTPSAVEAILHTSLPAAAGTPPPFVLASIAAFLVPASILLAVAALLQPNESPAVIASLGLALLSHGAFDVPLHALMVTASAQWAMLAMSERYDEKRPAHASGGSGGGKSDDPALRDRERAVQ